MPSHAARPATGATLDNPRMWIRNGGDTVIELVKFEFFPERGQLPVPRDLPAGRIWAWPGRRWIGDKAVRAWARSKGYTCEMIMDDVR